MTHLTLLSHLAKAGAVLGVAALALAAPTRAQQPNFGPPELIEAARKEGKLVFYTANFTEVEQEVIKAFNKRFPFVRVEMVRAPGGQLITRVKTEAAAGKLSADVIDHSDRGLMLEMADLFQDYAPPNAADYLPEVLVSPKLWPRNTIGWSIAYNKELVKNPPKSPEDLLTYAKAGHTLNPTSVSLRGMVADVVADHAVTVNPPEISVAETMPDVLADATLLRHVLDNLVGNAIKYTQTGVTPQINISAGTQLAGTVLVEVTDCGIGIPATDRAKAFDTFHRCANSSAYPGTGLGLAICKRIIEQHGGRIGVDENPGGGSRFWFTIPADRSRLESQ